MFRVLVHGHGRCLHACLGREDEGRAGVVGVGWVMQVIHPGIRFTALLLLVVCVCAALRYEFLESLVRSALAKYGKGQATDDVATAVGDALGVVVPYIWLVLF